MPRVDDPGKSRRPPGRLPVARLTALFVLLSVVPLALLAFFSVRLASNDVSREVEHRVRSNAALSAVAIQKEIEGVKDLAKSYAERPVLIDALTAGSAEHRRNVVRTTLAEAAQARPGITSAALIDPSGVLLSIVPSTPSIVGKNFSYRDWYRGVTGTGRTYVSEAIVSKATGHPRVVAIASPVNAGGRLSAILVVGYGLEAIHRFVEKFAASQGIQLTVTDQRGVLVARPGALSGLSSDRGDALVAAALRGESGVTTRKIGGETQLSAYVPISGLGWTVIAEVPRGEALSVVGKLRATVLGITGVLALVLVAGLLLLARSLHGRRRAEEAAEVAREEAERANRAKSEFLSRMSHELRTPLNVILGFGQLLELGALDERGRKAVEQIIKAGHHLLGLINEILDISRIEAGRLSLSLEAVAVDEAIGEALALVEPLAGARKITLTREGAAPGVYALADYQRLKQVLLNLFSNAVKYNQEGGEVAARVSGSNGKVVIEVADTGAGIAADQLERIFVPFERLDADEGVVEGTGLGLPLARRLVQAMGGTLTVESELGAGSTFSIEVPATEAPGPAGEAERAAMHQPALNGPAAAANGARTVLYVEDNLSNLRLMEGIFSRRPDLRLMPAMQGTLGLELAREHAPDLILLDLHLPDIGGEEVLSRLRSDPKVGRVPVIVLSADATPRQIERLRRRGANAYLTKPLDVQQLLETLDVQLDQG
jgi:signal transduction histidine kinase/CheY-like chemotaxis protein